MQSSRYDYTILGLILGSLIGMALGIAFFFAESTPTVGLMLYVGALLGAGSGALLDWARHPKQPRTLTKQVGRGIRSKTSFR